jgi:hypothetical protein
LLLEQIFMNTIKEQWDSFSMLVVPADAPPAQKREMRRSFYAGAEAFMRIQFALTEDDVSEAQAMKALDECHKELQQFAADVVTGKA